MRRWAFKYVKQVSYFIDLRPVFKRALHPPHSLNSMFVVSCPVLAAYLHNYEIIQYQKPMSPMQFAGYQFLVEGAKAAGLPIYFRKFSIRPEREFMEMRAVMSVRGVCGKKRRRFVIGFLECLDERFYIYCVANRRVEDLKTLFVGPPHPDDKHYDLGSIYAEFDSSKWKTVEEITEMRQRTQAFMMATHHRLGADSWLGKLDPHLMGEIARLLA